MDEISQIKTKIMCCNAVLLHNIYHRLMAITLSSLTSIRGHIEKMPAVRAAVHECKMVPVFGEC